jgi:hypothetical protein
MLKKSLLTLTAALGLTTSAFAANWTEWEASSNDSTGYGRDSTTDGQDGYEIQFQNMDNQINTVQLSLDGRLIHGHLDLLAHGPVQNVSLSLLSGYEKLSDGLLVGNILINGHLHLPAHDPVQNVSLSLLSGYEELSDALLVIGTYE